MQPENSNEARGHDRCRQVMLQLCTHSLAECLSVQAAIDSEPQTERRQEWCIKMSM